MRRCKFSNAVKLELSYYDGSVTCEVMEQSDALSRFNFIVSLLLNRDCTSVKSVRLIIGTHVRFAFQSNLYNHVNY